MVAFLDGKERAELVNLIGISPKKERDSNVDLIEGIREFYQRHDISLASIYAKKSNYSIKSPLKLRD